MQIEIQLDSACTEPRLILQTDRMTEELTALLQRLSEETPRVLAGFRGDTAALLEQEDILRVYAAEGKVFALTAEGEYQLRLRLYEAAERLDKRTFVRISNGEIVNLKKVRRFDLRLSGTICVVLSDGSASYVSRRYVAEIKKVLGL